MKGGVWDGYAGLYYATQRTLAELLLSLYLLEHDLRLKKIRPVELSNNDLPSVSSLAAVAKSSDTAR